MDRQIYLTKNNIGNEKLEQIKKKLNLEVSKDFIAKKIFVWNGEFDITIEKAQLCLTWLDKWEIIAPFQVYNLLLKHKVLPKEIIAVKKIVLDLRVPIYETGNFFIRNNKTGNDFWNEYLNLNFKNPEVRFSVALWKIKPFILTLPFNWFTKFK